MIDLKVFDRESANKSVIRELGVMCKYSLNSEDSIRAIAESYDGVILMYKNSKSPALAIEEQPVKELEQFWEIVSGITKHEFSELERYALSTDKASPTTFMSYLTMIAHDTGHHELANKFLDPILTKLKKLE